MTDLRLVLSAFLVAVTAMEIAAARTVNTPLPTHANIAYAPAKLAQSRGHLLDLYLPATAAKPVPVVIWTGGSGWKSDKGKATADLVAAQLNPAGLAVAGVSIRSSAQTTFPGQLHDIKAAIRWLRAHAVSYNLDPDHIGIMGASSGGWAAAMAAVTKDKPELEGKVGKLGVSSAVQAAVAFYPPTDFLAMSGAHDQCRVAGIPPSRLHPPNLPREGAGSQPRAVRHRKRTANYDSPRGAGPGSAA